MTDRLSLGVGCAYCGVFPLIFYVLFSTFYMKDAEMMPRLSLPVLCGAVILLYLANALLLRRGPSLPVLVGMDAALCVGVIAGVLLASRLYGFGSWLFAGCVGVGGCVVGVYTAFHPITIPKLLTQCDIVTILTLWMCLLEAGGAIPRADLVWFLGALLVVLACLLALRAFGGGQEVVYGSRLQGTLLSLGLLTVIGGLLYLFLRFLAGTSRAAVGWLLQSAIAGLKALWALIDRFFTWLLQFFRSPDPGEVPPPMEAPPAEDIPEELLPVDVDLSFLIIPAIVLAAVAVIALAYLVFRLRKTRLKVTLSAPGARHVTRRRPAGALRRRLAELWFRIRFRLVFLFRRGSPTGLLVWLERWGARRRLARRPGETHRSYLRRLAGSPPLKDTPDLPDLLEGLADALDRQYFGGGSGPLPQGTAPKIRRAFRRIPAKEAAPPETADQIRQTEA